MDMVSDARKLESVVLTLIELLKEGELKQRDNQLILDTLEGVDYGQCGKCGEWESSLKTGRLCTLCYLEKYGDQDI
ncbi:hypothetical protein UFOVP591_38 [uncultured Caudovirales phage]|uniref:Uncharacterized protein n=1 Tax=uncultured Caudovirales phage TaxID=2100421 RepID=A0A6J5N136_9CAUD|nr:hypothetical protein UFOVP591_38 [uncultured Caudovirales phage]